MDKQKKIEQEVKSVLIEGDMKVEKPDVAALDHLKPKYEVRVQTMMDPIVEETQKVREYAEEVDARYDNYMEKVKKIKKDRP